MIDVLIDKIKTWSSEKLLAYTDNFPLPDLPERNHFIQEKILDGLVIYSDSSLRYIGNDGSMIAITKTNDTSCYETLVKLHETPFRTVKPVSREVIDEFEVVILKNEFDNPGIPGFAEIQENNLNDKYFLSFVDNVSLMIGELDKMNSKFPGIINPYKFVRDDRGYFFNPYVNSLDEVRFDQTKEDFLDMQHKQLGYLLFAFKESSNIEFDTKLIKERAKRLWLR